MKIYLAILLLALSLSNVLGETIMVCERTKHVLKCDNKEIPTISQALWGRQQGSTCSEDDPQDFDASCTPVDVTDVLKARCDGKKKCRFRVNKRLLDRPCDGEGHPVVKVDYSCGEPQAEEGEVRIGDDNVAQFYTNGEWGTICDIGFLAVGWPDVMCQELNYAKAGFAVYATDFYGDDGYEPLFAESFQSPACNPDNAATMAECGQDQDPACDNTKDVYLRCIDDSETAEEGAVAVRYGPNENEGVAYYYRYGQWGPICDIGFQKEGWPSVVCLSLGYTRASSAVLVRDVYPSYDSSAPITFESPACNPGNAEEMLECGQDQNPSCGHDLDVYVVCE